MDRRTFTALMSAGAFGAAAPSFAQDTTEAIVVPDMILGSEDAPITMIEYASFTCPHCAAFHTNVFPQLKANYIDTGKVKFINREVYFDRLGLWAALLARCDGGSKYFGISDMIYKRQREWTQGEGGAEISENLKQIGRIAGFNDEQMDACLQDRDNALALVARFEETTKEDNVKSTPTLIIDGTLYNNMNYEDLAKILDEAAG